MYLDALVASINAMVLNGILAGILLGLAALWLLVLWSALWRTWLSQQHGEALELAGRQLGLEQQRVTLRPSLVFERQTQEGPIRLYLSGASGHPRAVLQAPKTGRVVRSTASGKDWLANWADGILKSQLPQAEA